MWQPYEERLGRPPDFLVQYRFYKPDEGGRQICPYQGYRSDLRYERNHMQEGKEYDGLYMVHPAFLTPDGLVMSETEESVPEAGTAYMWIAVSQTRSIHKHLAIPSSKCWFMEGSRKVADCIVVEQIGLIHES